MKSAGSVNSPHQLDKSHPPSWSWVGKIPILLRDSIDLSRIHSSWDLFWACPAWLHLNLSPPSCAFLSRSNSMSFSGVPLAQAFPGTHPHPAKKKKKCILWVIECFTRIFLIFFWKPSNTSIPTWNNCPSLEVVVNFYNPLPFSTSFFQQIRELDSSQVFWDPGFPCQSHFIQVVIKICFCSLAFIGLKTPFLFIN